MTNKDKELLLKDLCARLPYGVIVKVTKIPIQVSKDEVLTYNRMYSLSEPEEYLTVKPYLRPMSSMTKVEKEYVEELSEFHCTPDVARSKIDFYLEHHIDFRGLIPKGLALEAPEDMYKEE